MATLKRPRKMRRDQPGMFQTDDEPQEPECVAIDEPAPNVEPPPPGPRVYVKRYPTSTLAITSDDPSDMPAAAGATQRVIYLSRVLLFAEAVAPAWEVLPDEIVVSFRGEETPAPARVCSLLTVELELIVLGRLAAMEAAFERADGSVADVDYRTMAYRWRELQAVWLALPAKPMAMGGEA